MMTRRLVHLPSLWLVLLAGGHSSVFAQDSLRGAPEIRATATVRRTVPPDWAMVTLQYSESDSTPGAAMSRLSARTDRVRKVVQALGISTDSVIVGSSRSWWRGRMETVPSSRCVTLPNRPTPCVNVPDTTHRAWERIEIRIHAIHLVGPVIDSALAMGISVIPSVRFAATGMAVWEDEALREATRRVKERAEILAHESGGRLGPLIWLRLDPERSAPEPAGSGLTVTVPALPRGVVPRPYGMVSVSPARQEEPSSPAIEITVTVSGMWWLLPGSP